MAILMFALVYFLAGFARAMWTNEYQDAWWPYPKPAPRVSRGVARKIEAGRTHRD